MVKEGNELLRAGARSPAVSLRGGSPPPRSPGDQCRLPRILFLADLGHDAGGGLQPGHRLLPTLIRPPARSAPSQRQPAANAALPCGATAPSRGPAGAT